MHVSPPVPMLGGGGEMAGGGDFSGNLHVSGVLTAPSWLLSRVFALWDRREGAGGSVAPLAEHSLRVGTAAL